MCSGDPAALCERFHQTVLNEFYKVTFRKKIYSDIDTLQVDLDEHIYRYNNERTHQGKRCQGRTPMATFIDGKKIFNEKNLQESLAAWLSLTNRKALTTVKLSFVQGISFDPISRKRRHFFLIFLHPSISSTPFENLYCPLKAFLGLRFLPLLSKNLKTDRIVPTEFK